MSVHVWDTSQPLEPGFARDWEALLARSGRASFAFAPDVLAHQGRAGGGARAVRIEEGGQAYALVLRLERGEVVCGWPWRWMMLRMEAPAEAPSGLEPDDVERLFRHAERLAEGKRLRCYAPRLGEPGPTEFLGGATVLQSLELPEEAALKRLDDAKRRQIKKATKLGYEVVEASTLEQFRAFAGLAAETHARHGYAADASPELEREPAPGEGWREWELPWMRLLIAVREGRIEAGSGFSVYPGGVLDYRTNASNEAGRKEGANVLLAWEGIRRGAAYGCRWLNWGGATRFKRELGGTALEIVCRLGGDSRWTLPNLAAVQATHMRRRAASAVKRMRALMPSPKAMAPKKAS